MLFSYVDPKVTEFNNDGLEPEHNQLRIVVTLKLSDNLLICNWLQCIYHVYVPFE